MYIHFSKAGFWTHASSLITYSVWRLKTVTNFWQLVKELLKFVWWPKLHRSLNGELEEIISQTKKLEIQVGWIRFPTDGTRVQVFDKRSDRICKIAKKGGNLLAIKTEIKIRSGLGNLTPQILETSDCGRVFTEELINGKRTAYSLDIAIHVLGKLNKYLYDIEYIKKDDYLRLSEIYGKFTKQMKSILDMSLSAYSGLLLPVSQVHGDLSPNNILYTTKRTFSLIDWEYSRKCLVSYDCWSYLYDYYRHPYYKYKNFHDNFIGPLPDNFILQLNYLLEIIGLAFSSKDLIVLHLLNLIERNSFLSCVSPEGDASVIKVVRIDIDRAFHKIL